MENNIDDKYSVADKDETLTIKSVDDQRNIPPFKRKMDKAVELLNTVIALSKDYYSFLIDEDNRGSDDKFFDHLDDHFDEIEKLFKESSGNFGIAYWITTTITVDGVKEYDSEIYSYEDYSSFITYYLEHIISTIKWLADKK